MIEIWEPRWKDRRVLIGKRNVKRGRNIIWISGGPYKKENKSWMGKYEMSEIAIRSYPIESNGTIDCYAVPFDKLERL